MRKFKLFFACLLMAVLSIGQVWADPAAVGTTLFSENFGSYSANNVPSGSVTTATGRVVYGGANVTYACTNGGGTSPGQTKIYAESLATGTSPEILVGKYGKNSTTGGTFSITGIPSGGAKEITVSYKQNAQKLKVVASGTGYTSDGVDAKPSAAGTVSFDITVGDGAASTFDLTFSVYSSNVRVDDILVTVKTAGEGGGDEPGGDEPGGDEPGEDPDPTVTFDYSDYKGEGITSTGSPYTMEKSQVSIGDTKFFGNNNQAHFYANGVTTITPAAGVTITKMVLTATSADYNGYQSSGTVTASAGSLSHEGAVVTWTGSTDEAFTIPHNKQIRWTTIVVTYEQGEAPAVAKPTISGDENFVTSTTVTLSHDDADAIYYTTNGDDPTTSSAEYSAPFSLTNTATVKAIAVKGSDESAAAEKTFTKATVLSVAEARAAIDAGGDLTNKYVAGIISQIDSYNSTYHSITYWISDDGTTTDQLEVYSGLAGVVKAQFESVNDLAVGDDVTVKGTLKKYNSTYEFDYNNTIEAYKPIARLAWSAESFDAALEGENTFPSLTNTNGVTVSYSSSDPTKASFADASVYEITLNAAGSTTITATFAGNETYKANSASYTLNIASSLVTLTYNVDGGEAIDPVNVSALPNPLPTTTKAGKNFGGWFTDPEKEVAAVPGAAISENTTLYAKWFDPYTVAEAKTVIDANPDGIANQYVTGVISQIDSYNNTYHSITYWISADGTTTNQLQVYSGLIGNAATALEKEQFTAKTDLELGDEVVVTGTLKLHNSTTYEFDKNNTIYTFSRKESAGLAYAVTAVNKVVGDDAFVNELTNPNGVAVNYGTSDDQVAEVANDGTVTIVGEGSATITASFAGNAQYKAAQVSYTLTVSATVDTRHIANSPATFTTTNGNLDPADIAFEAFKGGAGTAPANYNNGIRLYQISGSNAFGGYITLTAVAGCTIDEVQITTTSTYSTTVAYSKDGNENLLKSESVSASGSYTTGTGLNVQSVNIVNLGTSGSGRLEIASIKVYYTGEALTIDHYELGGTYATEFEVGDDFNHNGLIVYAAYDALGENKVDITSACTFSTPDMSTEGQKTIDITYKAEVVKNYTITVSASTDTRKVAESPATFTAVSGDMVPADITFASYKGGASNDPYLATGGIRLYQISGSKTFGGFITLKAKKGCTIDQVKITTSAEYATTVAYSVDGNENLLGEGSVAKSGDYTTPAGLNVESVNILNLGTGSSGRLEIASIKVWYTGDALPVHHYILGGTYATEFEQYGEFNFEGLTVTAAYDELETITEAVTGFTVEADLSTAGNKKAEVMLNSVKIAEYDITVTASAKTDPALAYSPASVILTLGDALSAPTFSNTYNVSPITYSSDKPAVATVDAEGNIALAGGCGVAVITASFAENDDYIASEATFTITVNEPAEDLSGTWVVASSVEVGDRIIIADVAAAGAVKTLGAQANNGTGNNRVAVASTVDEYGILTPANGTKTFLVVATETAGQYALKALNGNYLYAASNSSNHLKEEASVDENGNANWTIEIDANGIATIKAQGNNSVNWIRYNGQSNVFSCYGATNSQADVVIYKVGTPNYGSYQRDVTNGNYGTICLPKAGTISGATLFEIADYDGSMIYVDEILNGEMEAGRPYIFQATSEQLNVTYTSSAVEETAGHANGLYGFYNLENENAQFDIEENAGNYILYSNAYWLVSGRAAYIANYRAYIKIGEIENTPAPQQGAPRRRVAMTVHGEQVVTGVDALNAAEAPVKMIIDGQLFIIRGEKMYNVNGQVVK